MIYISNKEYINYQSKEKLDLNRVSTLPDNAMLKIRPDLWGVWNFEKNSKLGLDIWELTKGSGKTAWFKCNKCSSDCNVKINAKVNGVLCVYCTNQKVNHTNSLASLMPDILQEWDYESNTELSPHEVVCFSNKNVWWKCLTCNSSYQTKVYNKTSRKQGCSYCSRRKVNHTNSLASISSEIAKYWHPTLNGELTPHDVTSKSNKKVWWLGECGHEWDMMVSAMNRYKNCPICSNHRLLKGFNDMWTTNPELASLLENPEDGHKYMQNSGKKLDWKCHSCESTYASSPNSKYDIKCRCPFCSNRKVNNTNSLSTLFPLLSLEWHPTKNGDLTPDNTVPNTNKKAWWICDKGHEWNAVIASRTVGGCGCPYCAGKRALKGYNDMWTTNPQLASLLADPEIGYKFTEQSNKKVNWKCPCCETIINQRIIGNVYKQGLRCPICEDYISYPEKVMSSVLRELNIKYEYDSTRKWSNRKRYDFYIPSLNVIIETHGGQHYYGGFERLYGKTFEDEQVNDEYKYELAIKNGIKPENYIVIDCRRSNFLFIKESIVNSRLSEIFNLDEFKWGNVIDMSNKSFKRKILDDWNSGNKDIKKLSLIHSLDKGTIVGILKEYSQLGMCDYSTTNSLYQLNSNFEVIKIYNSTHEAMLEYTDLTTDKIRKSNKNKKLLLSSIWLLCRRYEFDEKLNNIKLGGKYSE